ncbi:MAG: efflux RND transporter permease subunit [Bryobacteraceae bacterium]|nr:efflux RND transporter permease subunit [Bryobacteraceae bacterium]
MALVRFALRHPVTVLVGVLTILLGAWLAQQRMKVDIFPTVGSPAIYIAQPYGGLDPAQMEGFATYYYEYHLLYVSGIQRVESRSIQGAALIKLTFFPETDMDTAMSEVVSYANRARSFMPPGAVPPFITRFDTGSIAIGQLVFSSATRLPAEMQDIAINRVRPLFATLPGVSAPPPFGGNQRTIVVRLDPDKLRQFRMSPEEVITAVSKANTVIPSGVLRTGDLTRMAVSNSVISGDFNELNNAPIRTGSGPTVYVRDVGVTENGADVVTGYAHVNGKRTVYIPITKRAQASTLDVIQRVRENIPAFRKVVPDDVEVRVEFDQSVYVQAALQNLTSEGLLGALLTGLMALLFLRDWRGAVIVMVTIPISLLAALILLYATGQTINIMTLAGLALAVGVLVDEATVEIENIHTQMAQGMARARAVVDACQRTALPRLLSMLCVLAVFVPSYFMTGAGRQLFVPMSMAVGFAMIASYLLSSTLVPMLATLLMRPGSHSGEFWLTRLYRGYLSVILQLRWPVAAGYLLACFAALSFLLPTLGVEIFPIANPLQFRLRLRAPTGTRIERTELVALKALDIIKQEAGDVEISIGFIGTQPASYPVSTIQLWTAGPQEAVLTVALKPTAKLTGEPLKERIRARFTAELPKMKLSFEAGDIISQVMSFGSPTPVEVAVQGAPLPAIKAHAEKVRLELAKISGLRDLQYVQATDYPTVEINIDRDRAAQFSLTMSGVMRSVMTATSSSRFVEANYWRDPVSGNGFQLQVEIPQHRMGAVKDLEELPVMRDGQARPLLGDIATFKNGTAMGELTRYNSQRALSLTANLHEVPLGDVAPSILAAVARAGEPPKGITVNIAGQIPPLQETLAGLRQGLLLAVAAIFLLLAANFQSFRLSLAILATVPAVLAGAALALKFTGTTLNIQSYLGAIMAVGIAVANSILLVSFAEIARRRGLSAREAASDGASGRLRAILMTATAMVAGMVPLALGGGEGGAQTAPLARAVIGGLVMATLATLTVLPAFYAILQARATTGSASLDPDDPQSRFYETVTPA